jgi:signal transduction histidine kinase
MIRWRGLGTKLFGSHLLVTLLAVGTAVAVGRWLTASHVSKLADMARSGLSMESHLLQILNLSLFWAAGGAVLLAGLASTVFAWYLSRPAARMQEAARYMAMGDYSKRVKINSVDEMRELAEAFNHMAQSLESQEQLRRELIANVAHELRTPLTSIQGYMEALMDRVFPADASTFQLVHEEAGRLKRLAEELAQLASLESKDAPWNPEPLDVARVVEGAAARFRPLFLQKAIDLTIHIPPALPAVRGDRDQLAQVLNNLVINALQFTPTEGSVSLSAEMECGFVRIIVKDSGKGIPEEDVPHIFDRFYRADRSRTRATGGIGLGLTIVKKIVQHHGGAIYVESERGKGSTFMVALPVITTPNQEGKSPRSARRDGEEYP